MIREQVKYIFFNLRHVSKVAAHSQKKSKMFIYLLKYSNKESGKILKNEAAEPYLKPCQILMMEHFYENAATKSFIIDVWYGSKYTPEVVEDSKINLKWMNIKILGKTIHFVNVDLAENITT